METSIRFVRINGRARKPALCFRGRNQAHAVINDETTVRVVSNIPLKQLDSSSIVLGPVGLGTKEYPIDRFVERFLAIGQRKGMTLRAEYFLKRALEGGVADDEPLPPDEIPGAEKVAKEPPKPVTPVRDSPKPAKPPLKSAAQPAAGSRTSGADVIKRIAVEFKLEPTKLRKLLRAKGLRAPYDDEKKIREAMR